MCGHCAFFPAARLGLSRRAFHKGGLAVVASPTCVSTGQEPVEPAMRLAVAEGGARTVALTLDACSGATDMRIIEVLTSLSIPATIFVTGLWLRANGLAASLLLKRSDLFTVQNHGERHLPPVLGSRLIYGLAVAGTVRAVEREVRFGADAIIAAGGATPSWYRGATGRYSPAAMAAIEAMGYRIAGYSLNADDGASLPAASVARRIVAARNGEVILAHVNHPHRPSGAGVAAGIEALRKAGAVFVGLDAVPVTPLTCRSRTLAPLA